MTTPKSPLELAALATTAVPGMRVSALRPPTYSDELASVTGIEDTAGKRWIVTYPHEEVSGPALEATSGILDRLGKAYEHDYIPFDVPRLAGQATIRGGGVVYVHGDPGGHTPTQDELDKDLLLPASLGRALAALHNLPGTVFSAIGLPSYTAMECRDRNLALLDEAARQVTIPASLWNRWEAALEDVSLWRFPSAPVHGDVQERCLSVQRGSVLAIGGWTSAHVGDPALDIAWIQASASDSFLERFRETYGHERRATDLHVFTRAQLLSEIALVRWLVHGLHAEDTSVVNEAREMLADLAADLDGEPLLPSHAAAMGSRSSSIDEASPAPSGSRPSRAPTHDSSPNSRPIKWHDRKTTATGEEPEEDTGEPTQPRLSTRPQAHPRGSRPRRPDRTPAARPGRHPHLVTRQRSSRCARRDTRGVVRPACVSRCRMSNCGPSPPAQPPPPPRSGRVTPHRAENQHTTTRRESAATTRHKNPDLTSANPPT